MMSQQQNPETGETIFTRQAAIRDVRNLAYNVKPEPAPGNMSKKMLELQALLEMQERLPVPPEQIISKLEISATEQERWLAYIKQQEAAAQQKQEKLEALEIQFKDREIKVNETRNQQDFVISMAKLEQMAEKDEKNMVTKLQMMKSSERTALMQSSMQMIQMAAQIEQEELKNRQALGIDAIQAGQDLIQDAAKSTQEIGFDRAKSLQALLAIKEKHQQDMKFTKEKNQIALEGAEEKNKQAIKFAKQKAKEGGGQNGEGKPSDPKKP
jgi:hypothetical protein